MGLALLAATLSGCGKSADAPSAAAAPPVPVVDAASVGVIHGVVNFSGTPPVMDAIDNRNCVPEAPPLKMETIVVNPNKTLKNVIVYLQEVPGSPLPAVGGAPSPAALPAALLDQKFCQYVPHVIAVRVGQTLTVRSDDATMHNVHMMCSANPPESFGMIAPGQSQDVVFKSPEIFQSKCDVHPWMSAWIGVFDHPYFAVTGDDGAFQMAAVPPGSYKLIAWHETLPEQEADATVKTGQSTEADFTFAAP